MSEVFDSTSDPENTDFIASLGAAFMASRLLFAANNLDLFASLADGPRTLDEIATSTGLPKRSAHVLLHALAALRVLERRGDRFANGKAAQTYLSGRGPLDQRPGLRLYEQMTYPLWEQFEQSLRTGKPGRPTNPSPEFGRLFSEGVEAFTRPAAEALAGAYDFGPHRRVLDVGGGTGSYLLPILRRYPAISAVLYELPSSAEVARRRLSADPHGGRVEIMEGDALFDPLPRGYDVVLLAVVIHLFNPERVQHLFRRLREVVRPGARLLIPDYWVDSTHTSPLFAALLSGTFLLLSGDGSSYSMEEVAGWLGATGWRMTEHRPLRGAVTMLIAEAA